MLGIAIRLAIFKHNYHPRNRYDEDVTTLQVGGSELEFNYLPEAFTIWWQSGKGCEGLAEVMAELSREFTEA